MDLVWVCPSVGSEGDMDFVRIWSGFASSLVWIWYGFVLHLAGERYADKGVRSTAY